jgi:DNA-binding NtrC family response regulator
MPDRLLPGLVGRSAAWLRVREQAIRLTRSSLPLLVTGEPGSGKLALLRAMHADAGQAGQLTVIDAGLQLLDGAAAWLGQVHTAATRPGPGVLVIAHLEALAEPAATTLASLLDVHRRQHPALRWAATMLTGIRGTPPGLGRLVDRLGQTRLESPPLRQRPDDIPLLVQALSGRYAPGSHRQFWAPAALAALARLAWPGNIRQLEALVSALVVERQGAPIGLEHLPPGLLKQHALAEVGDDGALRLAATRRATIVAALQRAGGNKAEAARLLGIGRSTLYRQLAALRLDPSR